MAITLYGGTLSPFVRAVRLTLAEKGAAYSLVEIGGPDTKTPEHLARNPFGKVPVLDHDGFAVFESQAIMRYLDAALPTPPLTPTDPHAIARMAQVLSIVDCYIGPHLMSGIYLPRLVYVKRGRPISEAAIAESIPKATKDLEVLASILADNPYFCGTSLSLADLALAPHLAYTILTEEGATMLRPLPQLTQWLDRMQQRPSLATTPPRL